MTILRKLRRQLSLISCLSAMTIGVIPESIAQADSRIQFNPPKGGAPRDTRGGSSRGNGTCTQSASNSAKRLTLLTPANSNFGLTVAGHPTFFAYIPPTSAPKAFFSLNDAAGNVYYQTLIAIPKTGGVVRVDLPPSLPSIALGKPYQWGIAILCANRLRPDSPFVNAWIQRVEPSQNLIRQLKTATAIDQAALYSTHGIWYDTVETLIRLKSQQPTNRQLTSNWDSLLQTVGLDTIAAEPITQK